MFMDVTESFYLDAVMSVCALMGTDPVMMFSNNKEKNVDARGLLVLYLMKCRFTESMVSEYTGMTQQAVNRLKNLYPDRIKRNYRLFWAWQEICVKGVTIGK